MFARTERLTLRPGWPEDAAELTRAIAHAAVTMRLARVPWPYVEADAAAFLARPRGAHTARFLIVAHDAPAPRIVGGIGIERSGADHELGFWLTPGAWGRGYAVEAGRAVIAAGRDALPIDRVVAYRHADHPAAGHVLATLGFAETGCVRRASLAQRREVDAIGYALALDPPRTSPLPIAA